MFMCLFLSWIQEDNETVLGTNPNSTADQSKPYLETIETVLNLYSVKGCFFSLTVGLTRKRLWKMARFRCETARESTGLEERELTEFCTKLGEFCETPGELHWHANSRLKGTHWALSPWLSEGQKLTEFGGWNRTLRNRIWRVPDTWL